MSNGESILERDIIAESPVPGSIPGDDPGDQNGRALFDRVLEAPYIPLAKTSKDVEVIIERHPTESDKYQASVQDGRRQRAWSGEGKTAGEATTEAVRRFLGDRRSPEYVGKP